VTESVTVLLKAIINLLISLLSAYERIGVRCWRVVLKKVDRLLDQVLIAVRRFCLILIEIYKFIVP
jgi:hypothetical protein